MGRPNVDDDEVKDDLASENRRLGKRVRLLERQLRRMTDRAARAEHINLSNTAIAESMRRRLVSDLAAREEMLAELERQKQRAEGAMEAKARFVANISHEIRTPMNGVFGMLELLSSTTLSVDQREILDTARGSADCLLTLINDVLDFSKLEAGHLSVEPVPFDLRDCIDSSLALLRAKALASEVYLAIEIPNPYPAAVLGDPDRIRQVLVNLIGNAIKFAPEGEVRLKALYRAETSSLEIAVEDTGIGISEERQAVIFDPFAQADSSTTRRFGGTGLGLSISREIVRRMGGDLWVRSVEREGSTFGFSIRLPAADGALERLSRTVVVAVRDPAERDNILGILERAGAFWVVGHQAQLKSILREQPGALAVVDAALKNTLPSEFLDRVTYVSRQWDTPEAGRKGPPSLLPPVGYIELLRVLNRLVDPKGRSGEVTPSEDRRRKAHRVLVVEDNVVNQKLACRFLERAGYSAEIAQDGAEGVERVMSERFDVVLMDCQMPVMSGFEASRRIRALPTERAKVPIIAVTASAMAQDRVKCLEAGMDDVLTKPLQYQHLARILDDVLGL